MNITVIKVTPEKKAIVFLSFMYAFVITFSAFGPVLHRVISGNTAILMSCWNLFFLTIGFAIKPRFASFRQHKIYLLCFGFSTLLFTISFPVQPVILQWITLAIIGIIAGNSVHFWYKHYFINVQRNKRGRILGVCLFLSYGFLYLANVFVPSLSVNLVQFIPALLLIIAMAALFYYEPNFPSLQMNRNKAAKRLPWGFFSFILLIYITAGITYSGVYPQLDLYHSLERYYNVLPFVAVVLFAGKIADNKGRKHLLYAGLGFLGLSFASYTLAKGVLTYLLIQTNLQIGWALLDLYVWVSVGDFIDDFACPDCYAFGLSFIMAGVTIGSILSVSVRSISHFSPILYGFLAHIPIFLAFAFTGRIPETLNKPMPLEISPTVFEPSYITHDDISAMLKNTFSFTPRELQITLMIIKGYKNTQIAESICVSPNTVKYHLKNITSKMDAANRYEIRERIDELIKAHR